MNPTTLDLAVICTAATCMLLMGAFVVLYPAEGEPTKVEQAVGLFLFFLACLTYPAALHFAF